MIIGKNRNNRGLFLQQINTLEYEREIRLIKLYEEYCNILTKKEKRKLKRMKKTIRKHRDALLTIGTTNFSYKGDGENEQRKCNNQRTKI